MPRRSALVVILASLGALPATAGAAVWQPLSDRALAAVAGKTERVAPVAFAASRLVPLRLSDALGRAPSERAGPGRGAVLALPTPEGDLDRFRLVSAPVMERGLAALHPEIRTFAGQGIDDPTANLRLAVTPLGVHASVLAPTRAWYVEPRWDGDARHHVSFDRRALPGAWTRRPDAVLGRHEHAEPPEAQAAASGSPEVPLRTYRLAMVTDPSYAENSGALDGLPANATPAEIDARVTAAKAVLMTRVNQVYEQDLGVRMLLVDATDATNLNTAAEATGPDGPCGAEPCFTAAQVTGCSSDGLTRNVFVAGMLVGARNFDIGHLALGVDGGGVAQLGVVGDTDKARGCTGLPKPIGDFYAIDYVAHEMGHQFAGNHTFNGVERACLAFNRNLTGATAVEPGSGSSIMAYAGICGADDLQAHSDPYFSHASIGEMAAYVARVPQTRSSVQQVALREFGGADSLRLAYAGKTTEPIVRGANYSAAGIKAALEAVLPAGATATVAGLNGAAFGDTGFQVTFGGSLGGRAVAPLVLAEVTGATGVVGETVAGGRTANGGSKVVPSGNHAPEVSAPARHTIPVRTPFTLSATASDPDGDTVTYLWEQNDPGPPALGAKLTTPDKATGPLFRVFGVAARYAHPDDTYLSPSPGQNLAGTDGSRTFPDLEQVLADNTNARTGDCPPAAPAAGEPAPPAVADCYSEFLPTAVWTGVDGTGTLHFRVTARDNHAGVGGTDTADTAVVLARGAGPFRVRDLPALPVGAGTLPVAWDVARTAVLTGTSHVRVTLSADGGRTFPVVLAERTPNDGVEVLSVPAGLKTTRARLRVAAVDNVFFDVSHADFAIG